MKKYILLCILCLCVNKICHSQFYIKGYTGYAISTGNEGIYSSETVNTMEGIYSYEEYRSFYRRNFGQGVNFGLGVGYTLNKNIAFEVTGNTQFFSKFSFSNSSKIDAESRTNYYNWHISGFWGKFEYSNTMFQISPQIVFRSNPCNQWGFYMKGGPNLLWAIYKETFINPGFLSTWGRLDDSYSSTIKYSGRANIGAQFSFGTEYELSKNIYAFVELTTVVAKYKFTTGRALKYEIAGVDSLSKLESTYFDESDSKVIFNHTGLNIGIKYSF